MSTSLVIAAAAACLLVSGTAALAQTTNTEDVSKSPDGRFTFRHAFTGAQGVDIPSGYDIVETATGDVVLDMDADGGASSLGKSYEAVWSADDKAVAVNFHSGVRYDSFALYGWNGKKFEAWESPQDQIEVVLDKARDADQRKMHIPKATHLQHIGDTYKVKRWSDRLTFDLLGYTESAKMTDDDITSVYASLLFHVRRHGAGKYEILSVKPAKGKDADRDD